jgi:putative DNA primase/helicase
VDREAYQQGATRIVGKQNQAREEWPDQSWTPAEAAEFYADMGMPVFPVSMPQKTPLVDGGFHAATIDQSQVKKWWRRNPDAGIGLACGKMSGLAVIDIDVKNDAPGRENAKALATEYGKFTSALWSWTPSGGIHRFFRHDELPFASSAAKAAQGIDLRSSDSRGNGGGYVVLAPSLASGDYYRWAKTDLDARTVPDEIAYLFCFSEKERKAIESTDGLKQRIMLKPREEWFIEYVLQRNFAHAGIKLLTGKPRPRDDLSVKTPYIHNAIETELGRLKEARSGEQERILWNVASMLGSLMAGLGLEKDASDVQEIAARLRREAERMRSFKPQDPWDGPHGKRAIESKIERQFFGWGFDNPRDLSGVQVAEQSRKTHDDGKHLAAKDEAPDKSKAGKREIKLKWLDAIDPERTEWLWDNRIARGALNLFSGDPGQGKSQITCDLAARTSTGERWPDQDPGTRRRKPASVIILNAEDRTENIILPRLIAVGADLSRVAVIDSVLRFDRDGKPAKGFLSLQEDIAALDKMLSETDDVALIIIDPISAYLGSVKSHNDAEVRGVLGPLSALAETHNIAVLYIAHMNKGGDPKAIYRTQGSVAFVAAARSAYGVSVHPDDKDKEDPRRIFGPVKTNHAKSCASLEFEIVSKNVTSDSDPLPIPTSCVKWGGKSDVSIEEALTSGEKKQTLKDKAKVWLREYLEDGETLSTQVHKDGKAQGFSQRTLERAAAELGIVYGKEGKFGGKTMWSLPRTSASRAA